MSHQYPHARFFVYLIIYHKQRRLKWFDECVKEKESENEFKCKQ